MGNLLSLARVEGGGLRPRRQAVDLAELVQRCIERLGHAPAAADVVVDADQDLPQVVVDHTLVEQLVTNLLEDARNGDRRIPPRPCLASV